MLDLLLLLLLQTALTAVKSIRQEVHHGALPVTAHTHQAALGPWRLLLRDGPLRQSWGKSRQHSRHTEKLHKLTSFSSQHSTSWLTNQTSPCLFQMNVYGASVCLDSFRLNESWIIPKWTCRTFYSRKAKRWWTIMLFVCVCMTGIVGFIYIDHLKLFYKLFLKDFSRNLSEHWTIRKLYLHNYCLTSVTTSAPVPMNVTALTKKKHTSNSV